MTYDRKLIRNGNGWAMTLNSTILEFLGVNPEINMVKYSLYNNTLVIKKSDKEVENKKKN